jgi:magnesium transporter
LIKYKENTMFREVRKRARKAGQPPGTLVYTGDRKVTIPTITIINYNADAFHEQKGTDLDTDFLSENKTGTTWINVEGLQDIELIKKIADHYQLHPLTIEDILNNDQRPKVEEFENYIYITTKMLKWSGKTKNFRIEEFSIIIGKNYILTFQDCKTPLFDDLHERLRSTTKQRLREQGSDYLAYRLIDTIVDHYFIVLEILGNQIEKIEEKIITAPTPQNARTIYRLKHKLLILRKSIWPMREVISHLLQISQDTISSFTHVYLRDVYDHAVQAIDTLETFRDMLSNILDIYLSSLTARMNEIMKVLTMIATVFIPITFLASVFGMNFDNMPELHWHYGYYIVLGIMLIVAVWMIFYFKRKKWL